MQLRKLALALVALLPFVSPVKAQDALVVATCGTLPQAYAVGSTRLPTVDVNGKLCLSSGSAGLTVGTTTITGGTTTRLLYDNAGVLGESTALTTTGAAATATGLTALGIRDTSAAFDVTLAVTSAAALTAGRTLTLSMSNVAHTLEFGTTANTITFPSAASYTVAGLSVANVFSVANTFTSTLTLGSSGVVMDFGITTANVLTAAFPGSGGTSRARFYAAGQNFVQLAVGASSSADMELTWDVANGGGTFQTASRSTPIGFDGLFSWFMNSAILQVNSADVVISNGASLGFASGAVSKTAATTPDVRITRKGTANVQLGNSDAATAVAQKLSVQSIVAGTAATNGQNWTLIGSLSTGTGTSGDIIFQTGVAPGSGTGQATATTALVIRGETQDIRLPSIGNDAGLTDTNVCQDTTNHALKAGSGAAGICLGTSGEQFKNVIGPMRDGLAELIRIPMKEYYYRSGYGDGGKRLMRGPTAQDVEAIIPDLAGHNAAGETINYDWASLLFVAIRSIQQQQEQIESLQRRVR